MNKEGFSNSSLALAAIGDDGVLNGNVDAESPEIPLTAFNLAHRSSARYWEWLEAKGNEARLARFGCAMGATQGFEENGLGTLCGKSNRPFPSGFAAYVSIFPVILNLIDALCLFGS